jgi:lycopene beta-cyclase
MYYPRNLSRPYARVDREKFKRKLVTMCTESGARFLRAKVSACAHVGAVTHVTLDTGATLACSMVVDATGHSRRLVEYDAPFDPGYQVRVLLFSLLFLFFSPHTVCSMQR